MMTFLMIKVMIGTCETRARRKHCSSAEILVAVAIPGDQHDEHDHDDHDDHDEDYDED